MCLFTRFSFVYLVPFVVEKSFTTKDTECHEGGPLVRDHPLNFGRIRVADQGR